MCGLKVRFSQSPERRGVFEYALRVEVVSSEGIPSKIFVYHQFPAGIDGNTFAEFDHVATPVDLQEIPEDAASETVPWYRTDKCVAWFRCASDLKTAKQLFVDDITHLQRSYNILTREEDFEKQTTVVFSGEKVETEGGGNDPYEDAIEELRKAMDNKVDKDALEGVDMSANTVAGVRSAVKQIGETLGATVKGLAIAAALGILCMKAGAAGVYRADLNTLDLNKNPQVVTNVSLEGLASASNVDAMVSKSLTNYYTKAETEDAIDSLAAYYITFNADGDAFPTYSALASATNFYSGGQIRVPTRNDYCVVLADEEHGGSEWRYIYAVHEGASSGQWEAQYPIETNDYEGLSNKPQIGGVELFGNKSAAQLGLLPSDENALVGNSSFSGAVVRVSPPADTSDCVKTNDLPTIISASSPSFSNAVLSVGLGIDTNTVSAINALIEEDGSPLPSGGTATVGALLLALAAAVAALRRKKLDANAAITGATKCKVTYDAKGLVTGGADLGESDIPSIPASKISDFADAVAEVSPDISGKLDSSSAAPEFDATATYDLNDYVTHDGVLYRCTSPVATAGSWDASKWTAVDMTSPDATLDITANGGLKVVAENGDTLWEQGYNLATESSNVLACDKVGLFTFAAPFDAAVAYAKDARVTYGNKPYKFKAAHSAGAWVGTDAEEETFAMPTAAAGKVGDFGLYVDNTANTTDAAGITLVGLDSTFSVVVPKGVNLSTDILSFAAGEMAALYFTLTPFKVGNFPTWEVFKQVVENGGAQS